MRNRKVFLHGLGQTPQSWTETVVQLKSAGHSICPDLAEMLQGKEASYQNLYEAVLGICDQIDGGIDLCGLSLGGVLALNYAIERPKGAGHEVNKDAPEKLSEALYHFYHQI